MGTTHATLATLQPAGRHMAQHSIPPHGANQDCSQITLPAFLPGHGLTVLPDGGDTVGGALGLAPVGVGHPRLPHLLGLVVPQLLLRLTLDLRHNELDMLDSLVWGIVFFP